MDVLCVKFEILKSLSATTFDLAYLTFQIHKMRQTGVYAWQYHECKVGVVKGVACIHFLQYSLLFLVCHNTFGLV